MAKNSSPWQHRRKADPAVHTPWSRGPAPEPVRPKVTDEHFQRIVETLFDDPTPEDEVLTPAATRAAEKSLAVALPQDLLTVLYRRNGGLISLAHSVFPAPNEQLGVAWVNFHRLLGIGNFRIDRSLLELTALTRIWGLPDQLVPLNCDGYAWIVLDYRKCGPGGPPSVVWFGPKNDAGIRPEHELAPDFRSFVCGLTSVARLQPGDEQPTRPVRR